MIRDYSPADFLALAGLHRRSGADYVLPDLESPLFLNRIICERNGNILAAGLHRVCFETFALVDPDARPQEKWAALQELNAELSTRAYQQGLDETHAAVPPIGFDKRLRQLGWEPDRDGWKLWTRRTNAISSQSSR